MIQKGVVTFGVAVVGATTAEDVHRAGSGGGGGSDAGSVNSASSITRETASTAGDRKRIRRRRSSKGCAVARRLQEASCGAVRALFHRLLACTTSVEVADAGEPTSSR